MWLMLRWTLHQTVQHVMPGHFAVKVLVST
jgi:hypothetical protein